jgi:ABC-type proline/glycine betaine transport system permease subunit
MPNPKDYMDGDHVYVRGHVRRKHLETKSPPELSPEASQYLNDLEDRHLKLVITSWIIHILIAIISGILAFIRISGFHWRILCGFVFVLLSILLIIRIKHWWDERI